MVVRWKEKASGSAFFLPARQKKASSSLAPASKYATLLTPRGSAVRKTIINLLRLRFKDEACCEASSKLYCFYYEDSAFP